MRSSVNNFLLILKIKDVVFINVQAHQTVHIKDVQFFVYKLHLIKLFTKKKKPKQMKQKL